jgi:DNA-binding NarL/FixJ family response regulator
MTTRILLADDHRLFREGLRALLEQEPDMKVVGEADDGRAVQALARQFCPHVVIMDVSMPQLNGIDATRELVVQDPGVRVLGVSSYADRHYVAQMLAAGAPGYLVKAAAGRGPGLGPAAVAPSAAGGMSMAVASAPGLGTTVPLTVPLRPAAQDPEEERA